MSAFPESEILVEDLRSRQLSPVQVASLATILAVLGFTTIWPSLLSLWTMWMTDALKSIGMLIPLVSLVLILRAWRTIGWRAEGTWWGLPILLFAVVAAHVQQQLVLILVISPEWSTALPPPAFVLLAYGIGVVLLIGGTALFRAALFPTLLLWFANPVPHAFSLLVDLPLQETSAHIARAFAMHLGYSLTPDHLRLMFTPDFGMFIAPGCNGIRGSVTMGLIALIAGYIYRFKWYAIALVVTAAILLGYLFNFLRLCLLVLYYAVAMHFPSLQSKAENADYVIGAVLFLSATVLLFAVIDRLRGDNDRRGLKEAPVVGPKAFQDDVQVTPYGKLAVMGLAVLVGGVGLAQAEAAIHRAAGAAVVTRFPQRLGDYTMVRTWNETLTTGAVVYNWAEYVPLGGGTPVSIGVSPILGWHDPLMCHVIRGDKPVWQGQLLAETVGRSLVGFSSAFYDDGVTRSVEASTVCSDGTCGEFATKRTHFGFIYSHPAPKSVFRDDLSQPTPVLLRAETINMTAPADVTRLRLTEDLKTFLASTPLEDLVRPYSR